MYVYRRLLCIHTHSFVAVEKKFPGDRDRLARLSLIEGSTQTYYTISVVNIDVIF